MRDVPGQDRGENRRRGDLIVYRVVPYLLVAAPPIIVLLSVMLGGCMAARTDGDPTEQARFHSDPDSRAGEALVNELKQRETRAELQRIIDEAQR
jgi:hypothetical protein